MTAVKIPTSSEHLVIGAVYHSPSLPITTNDLDTLLNINGSFLYAGDMNAKHTSWNSRIITPRGRTLHKHAEDNDYDVIGPKEYTHYPRNPAHNPDVLDVVMMKSKANINSIDTITEFNSDHEPVIVVLDTNATETMLRTKSFVAVNWPLFLSQLSTTLPVKVEAANIHELDEVIRTVTNTIVQAKAKATTHVHADNFVQHVSPEILQLISYKKQVRKKFQRLRLRDYKTELNYLTKRIHTLIQDQRIRQFTKSVQDAMENNQIWKIAKRLKATEQAPSTAIQGKRGPAFNPQEKAQAIADVLEENFRPIPEGKDSHSTRWGREVKEEVQLFLNAPPTTLVPKTSASEVKRITNKGKTSSAPGPDGLSYETLKNLPHQAFTIIAAILNLAMSFHYFPSPWKTAHITTIPKPGKNPSLPQNRRPISILNTIGKIYERLILNRILHHALKIIPDTQFGFVPHRSTTLQLLRITNYIQSGFANFEHTAAVFLDVEKAYDTIWTPGLIYKLIQLGFPDAYIHLLASYLSKRRFRVKIEGALSTLRSVSAGVPQGSVLAPTLYNLYVSDLPSHDQSQVAQYADDTALFYKHYNISSCTNTISEHLQKITQWCSKWRIKINEEKTQYIVFSKRRPVIPAIRLGNKTIAPTTTTKYLGVYLDRRLSWHTHFKYSKGKAAQKLYLLYPILRSTCLPLHKKLSLYKIYIRTSMLYAAPIWRNAAREHINSLQKIQNRTARLCTGADR